MATSEQNLETCQACKAAVVRAYRELRASGVADRPAFEAAVNVLALRHPERDARVYQDAVAAWLTEEDGS